MENNLNIDELMARAAQINTEMTQCRTNYAKLEGHLSEITHWIQEHQKKLASTENGESANDEINNQSAE